MAAREAQQQNHPIVKYIENQSPFTSIEAASRTMRHYSQLCKLIIIFPWHFLTVLILPLLGLDRLITNLCTIDSHFVELTLLTAIISGTGHQ